MPLGKFFEHLVKVKMGDEGTLLDLFLIAQQMNHQQYYASVERKLFELDPHGCLAQSFLTGKPVTEGYLMFMTSMLRAYYVDKSKVVLVGAYFASECIVTKKVKMAILGELIRLKYDAAQTQLYLCN